MLSLERCLDHIIPSFALQIIFLKPCRIDFRTALRYIYECCDKSPFAHEEGVVLCWDEGEEDANGVGGGQEVNKEEIVDGRG